MKKIDIKRFFIRLRVFFRKRFRFLSKHPKRTLFSGILILLLAVISVLMFATPVFFNATVRFETGAGSVVYDKTIRRGTALPNIENPTYEYNTFGGWYFDEEYTKPYENQKIYSDTVLYAKWNTIFTEEYFEQKINLLNDMFDIDIYNQVFDVILSDQESIYNSLDDIGLGPVAQYVDMMVYIDYDSFYMNGIVAKTKEQAKLIIDILSEIPQMDTLAESNNFVLVDKVGFMVPKGMEAVFFGDLEKQGDFYYSLNDDTDTYTLIRYNGDEKIIHIPYEFNNKPVDYIASHAFSHTQVEEVYFTENIKEIGFSLFLKSNVKRIDLSTGLKRLSGGALCGVQNLEEISLGESIESIGFAALSECPSLREITLDENNSNYILHEGALYDKEMKKLIAYPPMKEGKSYVVPEGVEELDGGSFAFNRYLENITLPQSLKLILDSSFKNCFNLKEITIPDSVETMKDMVFMESSIENIHIAPSSNLKEIGMMFCYRNQNLKEFYIPAGVNSFFGNEFEGCTNLERVTFAPGNNTTQLSHLMFANCHSLNEINIPATVHTINKDSFANCSSLKEMDLRNVAYIHERAFFGCSELEEVNFSSRLSLLSDNSFEKCESLIEVEIPYDITQIGVSVFSNTNIQKLTAPIDSISYNDYLGFYFGDNNSLIPQSLKTVIINNTTNSLPQQAFEGCEYIERIELPEGVRIIRERAFKDCVSLTDITLLEGLVEIGNEAFLNCSSITVLNMPSSLEIIGDFAFSGNDIVNLKEMNLTEINFTSNNVRSIGSYAFSYNENLQSFEFSENLNYIGSYAFENCSAFTEMNIISSSVQTGIGIFKNCENLQSISIPMNNTYENNTPSYLAYYFDGMDQEDFWKIPHSLESVTILDGITSLPDYAFYRAEYLQEVNLPQSVENIGDYSFMGINSIPMAISKINMPESSIKSVGKQAFQFCPLIENLNLGEDIQEVGEYAFEGSGLKELHIPNAQNIGVGIFKGCESLQELTVPLQGEYNQLTNSYMSYYFHDGGGHLGGVGDRTPASLKTINITDADKIVDRAFWDCQNIENINLPNSVEEIGEYAFFNNINLQTINLGSGLKYIRQFAFNGCGLLTVEIPSAIIEIKRSAFEGCLTLQTVEFDEQIQYVTLGERAFFDCQSLTDINLPNGIYEIRQGTFQQCSSLTQINLPEGLQYLRSLAFESSGLESISIPYKVQEIEFGAFRYNENLSNIDFDYEKSRLKTIGQESFLGCESLQSVTIPQSVLEIVDKTFNDCINLKEVYILREFNNNEPSYLTKATRLNTDEIFENCHDDLTIYVPENNAGNSNGVEMYQGWFGWENYADRIEAMP